MKITPAQLLEYRQQIEESDLAPDIKAQALLGIGAIEANDGDLEVAADAILSDLPDTEAVQLLRYEDLVHDFPKIANNKALEEECFAKFLAYCKENNRDPREKSSWSAYVSKSNVQTTVEKLPSNPEVWVVKTVQ